MNHEQIQQEQPPVHQPVKQAMILGAGRGERLRPYTDTCPKPLIQVGGFSLLSYHLHNLKRAGVERVVINVWHLGDKIIQAIGDGKQYGLEVTYSLESSLLDTGGGIFNALSHFGHSPFILVNGDVWTDYDFSFLVHKTLAPNLKGHFVLVPPPSHAAKGDFGLSNGFLSKEGPLYTYAGIALLHPALFKGCQSGVFSLVPLIIEAILHQQASAELYFGQWHDVGTKERWQALDAQLNSLGS